MNDELQRTSVILNNHFAIKMLIHLKVKRSITYAAGFKVFQKFLNIFCRISNMYCGEICSSY